MTARTSGRQETQRDRMTLTRNKWAEIYRKKAKSIIAEGKKHPKGSSKRITAAMRAHIARQSYL